MKSVTAILVVLCLTHLQNANADVKALRKTVITAKKLVFWIDSYTDERLTYALCERHSEVDEIKCTVIQEKTPYGDNTRSCDVALKRPHGRYNPKLWPRISIYPFGQKYVALTIWEEREYRNYTVVQMDSCKVSEVGFHVDDAIVNSNYVPIVGHNGSFDVFFNNRHSCGDKLCKATIDVDGRIINEAKPSIKKIVRTDFLLRPILAMDNGYYYVTEDMYDYVHLLVKPDGTEKTLTRHQKALRPGMVLVSNKNNLLGVCYRIVDRIECNQYDSNGDLKFHKTITINDKDRVYFDFYNLPNGGFYVASAKCSREKYQECISFKEFFMERVDATGWKTGPIILQEFDKSALYRFWAPQFYKKDSEVMCFSLAGWREFTTVEPHDDQIDLITNCFTDADFSK